MLVKMVANAYLTFQENCWLNKALYFLARSDFLIRL